jgi:cytochrome-b5 reductase
MRPYTPTTDDATPGTVDFVIKVYPTGRVTPALDSLKIGDCILAKGPKGRFTYKPNMAEEIGLVAGGTGITPMFAVAMAALRKKSKSDRSSEEGEDKTRFSLVFANVTEDDILIRDKLEALARGNPERFKVHYVLNEPPKEGSWNGSVGFVTKEILAKHLPAPGSKTLVLRCGPGPMNKAVGAALEELGYSKEMTFEF